MAQLNTPLSLGQRIEAVRKSKGLTQDELAAFSNCSRRTIIKLEKGGNIATHTLFQALASLGMTMDILEKGTDFRALRELQEQRD
ncbi:helix-turn-helix domain-containing protein [Pseudomonas amygdali]|uniref:HTH cro/C1-type domain-containing protein n=2 Tax=Pseudomonas amygdali pv. lachrymans TaxID=53707 RepID=A0ABR5KQU1_PSEAV|nr:helix-turn-helix transcriptional regulator [Pseudomonas amygdali]AXH59675.1 XRE family transcriptional regulator [Pseudomonas amygdali pv. lachrymans str. M301315]KPC17102.1 Uncharacterized protein AC499_0304 [Pseudomonas amygdali pv. lachrymans]KPC18061.1 Uncharacterized protein AC499_1263 [Pseudomonas amygdali pv. lachrymans]RMT06422.1 hypothetical protein ALP54_03584 [Pseudomonas amygdali pv. lachrymans]